MERSWVPFDESMGDTSRQRRRAKYDASNNDKRPKSGGGIGTTAAAGFDGDRIGGLVGGVEPEGGGFAGAQGKLPQRLVVRAGRRTFAEPVYRVLFLEMPSFPWSQASCFSP